ncbi:hypothetical protein [Bdellovibrio sp.]|uniref:hypothetical protein n=1 Tax=Bdellovibrio sp. TaxID=28201 RepID=UPI0039E65494
MNKQINKILSVGVLIYAFALTGCQAAKEDSASGAVPETITAEKPSLVMGAVQGVIVQVGQGLASQSAVQSGKAVQGKILAQANLVNQLCNEHAMPIDELGNYLDTQSPDYPQRLFYCKLSVAEASGDSIPGSLHTIRAISCAIEKAGVVFDDQEHQVTVVADSSCFTPSQLANMGVGTMVATVRASKPAFFNSYYDTGISITSQEFGTYRLAAKVSGTTVEFLTEDDQSAVSPNKSGANAASFDLLTGKLRFESRSDRFLCAEQGSCGWSRHDRIVAQVSMTNGEITGVSQVEGIASDIYDSSLYNGTQFAARIATIKGNLNQGLKTRYYYASTQTGNDLADASKYIEVPNNRCHTNISNVGDCGVNTGIELSAQGAYAFGLHPAAQATSPAAWVNQLVGLKFDSVSFADIQ